LLTDGVALKIFGFFEPALDPPHLSEQAASDDLMHKGLVISAALARQGTMNKTIISRASLLVLAIMLRPAYAQPGADSANRVIPVPPTSPMPAPLAVNPLTGLSSVSALNYKPLTRKERVRLYWTQNYWSYGAYVGPVLSALLLDQASGSPKEWGGGLEGFGRRVGSRTLSSIVQGNFQAVLAAPLREDVRYISSGNGGFGHRVLHAVVFSFLTYNQHGHATLNIAGLTGHYGAVALSTTWVPTDESLGRYTLIHGSQQVGLAIPIHLIQEFWPDLQRKILHRP